MKKISIFLVTLALSASYSFTQNTEGVSISETVTPPDVSAMLDVSSQNKGVLFPRLALVSTTSFTGITVEPVAGSTPPNGLIVYNTATVADVKPGFYYWETNKWLRMGGGNMVIPHVTYEQMINMRSSLTLADRGMMVFVISNAASLIYYSNGQCYFIPPGAQAQNDFIGLWFLSSPSDGSPMIQWQRVKFDYGTTGIFAIGPDDDGDCNTH